MAGLNSEIVVEHDEGRSHVLKFDVKVSNGSMYEYRSAVQR